MTPLLDELRLAAPLIDAALAEDVGPGDATTEATVPPDVVADGTIRAKEAGVLAGLPLVREVFARTAPDATCELDAEDGDRVAPGDTVVRLRGRARGLLTGERVALNFLQHLSGIATATAVAVARLEGTGTRILDTRKTVPGMRLLAKYAVRCGGGVNHRRGLYDMILIKENHVAAAGGVAAAIRAARAHRPDLKVEIEVRDARELAEALAEAPDRVMLDNFAPEAIRAAVATVDAADPRPEIEVSGGVTPETVRDYALPGVDFISSGSITHSPRALDLSMLITARSDA